MNDTPVTHTALRRVLSDYVTGVTIVTVTKPDGTPYGLTVNSFNSVSLNPPLVLWSLDNKNAQLALFEEAAGFAVNIMAADQTELCQRFAGQDTDRFSGTAWEFGHYGHPLIAHALAHIECRPWRIYEGGDHSIFVGEVMRAQHLSDRPAATFFKGQLGHYGS
jgi:flavin reductase (DIM6/NTAB) family NADH-FMN oxidoreductase RutF